MFYDTEQDPLCYPGTTVLINKAGLRSQQDLDDFEFSMFLTRAEEPFPDGELGYSHYRAFHHHLFQDVYDWAGQPRTIRIGKGGSWFCFPENLEAHMGATFDSLSNRGYLKALAPEEFAAGAAAFLADVNAGHPFREGNGRTQLSFLKLLVINAGYPFNDDAIEPASMLAAMIRSFHGDFGPLASIIGNVIAMR